MHFDALTLACIADELRSTILGGRVQQVLLPDAESTGLEVYAQRERQYLLLSAEAGAGRVHLSSVKLRRGAVQETPLLLLLRKYVRGAALAEVAQPDVAERVLYLRFDHPEHGVTALVVEPMGRLSNVLLLDAGGKILECVRRVPGGENARRVLLPGRPYAAPPPQGKLPPVDDGRPDYYDQLAAVTAADGLLWKAVVAHVAGVSPTQAREIAWRATGTADAPARDAQTLAVAQALQEFWSPVQNGGWLPGNVMEEDVAVGFSPYPVHFRGQFMPCASMSEALERYYATPRDSRAQTAEEQPLDEYAAARAQAAAQVRQAQQRVNRQLEALAADEPAPGEPAALRTQAEWLLALGYSVQPRQDTLEVDVQGDGSEILRIALDPQRTPVEQAQRMFKRAAKLERAAKIIPRRRAKLETDLEFLAQLEADVSMAENRPEIAAVQEELRDGGFAKAGPKTKREKAPPPGDGVRRFTSPDGYEILAGRNARQNEAVTFRVSHSQDVWLHARGVAGAHVVIRSSGGPVSEASIRMAAQMAAYYSQARGERSAAVTMTERRHVRRLPGGHTGQVLVRNEETVYVPGELPGRMRDEG